MRKILQQISIILLIVNSSTILYGQNKLLIGGSLTYDFLMLEGDTQPWAKAESSPSFSLGLITSFHQPRLIVDISFNYSQINYDYKVDYTYFGNDPIISDTARTLKQGYFEITPKVNFAVLTKSKTSLYLGLGGQFLLKILDNGIGINPSSGFLNGASTSKEFQYGLITTIGLKRQLNEKISIRFEPNFKLSLSDFDKTKDFGKINRIGLSLIVQGQLHHTDKN